jgi:hypothetical protein
MFIAFEGPDNTGKSTSATNLAHDGVALYNATKEMHEGQRREMQLLKDDVSPVTYDRIDWFSHMVYRLALPEHEWNDERPRTVFAMPDTHLVIKLHRPDLAPLIDDELYETGKLAEVNPMYYYFAKYFMGLNEEREYALFKTVSIVEVANDPRDGTFSQQLMAFSSAVDTLQDYLDAHPIISTDEELLELFREDERQRA